MCTLMTLLFLCLVASSSLGVEHCKCQSRNETSSTSPEEEEEFKLTVDKKGTKVEERIKIDKRKQTERFHVPAHNDLGEADVIFDFKQNLSMYRLPQRKMCYLLPLDPIIPSPKELSKILQQQSSGKAENREIERKYKGVGEVKDRTSLSDEMAIMCAKFPIYRLKPATSSKTKSIGRVRTKRCTRICIWLLFFGFCWNWC